MLKKKISMKAKFNLWKSINIHDVNDSKRWLERKLKDEFSLRQETTGRDWEPMNTTVLLSIDQMNVIANFILDKKKHIEDNKDDMSLWKNQE